MGFGHSGPEGPPKSGAECFRRGREANASATLHAGRTEIKRIGLTAGERALSCGERTWKREFSRRVQLRLGADDLIQAFYDLIHFFRGSAPHPFSNAFNNEGSNLADLDPRPLGKVS